MTFKERAHDLFIPIRRKQRSSSGETSSTATSSTSISSYSEAPKTPTRRTNGFDNSRTPTKTSTFVPLSGVRYTVPATTKNYDPFNFIPKSSSPLKSETTALGPQKSSANKAISGQQDVRHSRHASSPAVRVARQSSPVKHMPRPKITDPIIDPLNLELQIAEEQITRTAMPTPFPSPDSQTGEKELNSHSLHPNQSHDYTAPETSRPGRTRAALASHIDSSIFRPQSRDSSRSSKDRSHPPSSFPANLHEQIPNPAVLQISPSKVSRGRPVGKSTDRKAKRYTILGVPSITSETQASLPRRRNSVGPLDSPDLLSQHAAPVQHVEQRAREQGSGLRFHQMPQPHSQSSSRPSSRHSYSSSLHSATHDFSFHTVLHHYTTCSHTSPPKSRPLNEQPYLEAYSSDSSSQHETYRNVIRGSCFDCDTAARRGEETQILLQFSPEISRLMNDLTYLVAMVEEMTSFRQATISPPRTPLGRSVTLSDRVSPGKSSIATRETTGSASTVNTTTTNVFTDSTSVTSESSHEKPEAIERQIAHLQHVIAQLSTQRDYEVNRVWRGYSARWGPGTLGVVQTKRTESVSSRSVSRAGNRSRPISMIETSYQGTYDTTYLGNEDASILSSAQHSPQRDTFLRNSSHESERYGLEEGSNENLLETPHSQAYFTPPVRRSQSVRTGTGTGTSANSLYSSVSHHHRARSRDSTPNTPFGGRSVARTETGISYSNSDTPVGRMKVNWLRAKDQD